MSDNYLGEIRLFAFGYAPTGWVACDGSLLSVTANTALYSLLGIQYGGDGKVNFGVPDLRGRAPVHLSASGHYIQGKLGGAETVTLTMANVPSHTHSLTAAGVPATTSRPTSVDILAQPVTSATLSTAHWIYATPGTLVAMNPLSLSSVGGNGEHNNMQPFMVLNFCIATSGVYPQRA
jgi:microcystin-dependent protein